jgi:hypothetical protein
MAGMVLFNIRFKERDEANKRSLALPNEELFRCSLAAVALRLFGATPRSYINPYEPTLRVTKNAITSP